MVGQLSNDTGDQFDSLVFSPDRKYLYAQGSYSGNREFWDLSNLIPVSGEPFGPDLSNTKRGEVWSWNSMIRGEIVSSGFPGINFYTPKGDLLRRFDFEANYHFSGLAFSPDGTMIAFGLPGNVQIWGIGP